jgi:hypothetical protein
MATTWRDQRIGRGVRPSLSPAQISSDLHTLMRELAQRRSISCRRCLAKTPATSGRRHAHDQIAPFAFAPGRGYFACGTGRAGGCFLRWSPCGSPANRQGRRPAPSGCAKPGGATSVSCFSTGECMHSSAYCRRQARTLASQARDPHVSADRRAVLEHLSHSWAICATASAFVERHAVYPPARKPRHTSRRRS